MHSKITVEKTLEFYKKKKHNCKDVNFLRKNKKKKLKKCTYTHTLNEYNNKTVQNYPGKLVSSNI